MMTGFEFVETVLSEITTDPNCSNNFMGLFEEVHWLDQEDKAFFANELIEKTKLYFLDAARLDNNFSGIDDYTSDKIATWAAHINYLSTIMKRAEDIANMMVNN